MTKKYYHILKSYYQGLWHLTDELRKSIYNKNFNEVLKQYGLYFNQYNVYEVINEELFSLFLLEYSDRIIIEQYDIIEQKVIE